MDDMKRFSTCLSLVLLVVIVSTEAFATEPPAVPEPVEQIVVPDPSLRQLDTIVVSGNVPGPGMWKVSKGDHVLWILGTVSRLPSGIEWKSDEVVSVLHQSDEVLDAPGFVVDADIGIFRGIFLLPSALKAGKNPDGKTLKDVLSAGLYARWTALKPKYFGRDGGIEKKRPLLVANELYAKANRLAGLRQKPVISPVINGVLEQRKMKTTPTAWKVRIADPKAAIKEFGRENANDLECFRTAMDRVEKDMPTLVARANAWSVGDIDALRALSVEDQQQVCMAAFLGGEYARKRGIVDVEARVRARWLEVAEAALAKNRVTFATMQMSYLLPANGYLASLRAKGYAVEDPL
jgi:hypothetical protein